MHTNPEVLALLALGEDSATPAERDHVASCEICSREVAELAHLAGVGRAVQGAAPLESPRAEVWERIRAEIGFGSVDGSSTACRLLGGTDAAMPTAGDRLGRAAPQPDQCPTRAPLPARQRPGHRRDPADARPAGRRILALALAAVIALIVGVGIGLGWSALSRPTPTVIGEAQLDAEAPSWTGSSRRSRAGARPVRAGDPRGSA